MDKLTGFGRLQTPNDLLGKLRHDHGRIRDDPNREYAAFDFFVTAYHLTDWLWPGDAHKTRRKDCEKSNPLLQVTSHIANGVKHFKADRPQQQSVSHADFALAAFDADAFDPEAFQTTDELVVTLEGPAAAALGAKIGILDLADRVLAFWEAHFQRTGP